MARQDDLNSVFLNEVTALKEKVETLLDVANVLEWAVDSTLEQLEACGSLPSEVGLLHEYRRAITALRKQGFALPRGPAATVNCPGCKATLRGVSGAPGERCDWCGYQFK